MSDAARWVTDEAVQAAHEYWTNAYVPAVTSAVVAAAPHIRAQVLPDGSNIGDATYVALMHPGVATALADWLEEEAECCESLAQIRDLASHKALAVADAVLGAES